MRSPARRVKGRGLLRSVYRRRRDVEPGRFDVRVELTDGQFETGDLLGMCTGLALNPTAATAAVTHDVLATRLVLRPEPPERIEGARSWTITDLQPVTPAIHAGDGPVSAWIERADGTTIELGVVPAAVDPPPSNSGNETVRARRSDNLARALLPRPAALTSGGRPRYELAIEVVNDPAQRWPAVAALARRLGIDLATGREALELDAAIERDLNDGAYELEIDGPHALIRGGSAAALTHGMITLAQLTTGGVPERLRIADAPRHGHRGLSVDLARRWFEPAVVERLIDVAAWRKLSHLQLHLTDDEAWRVPVDAYPALAEIGGVRGYGLAIGPLCGSGAAAYGRAYTAAEIGRWVERAEALSVELVPEIDIPGHCHAAIVAVPELGDPADRGAAVSVQGFRDNVLIPSRATTRFLHEAFGSLADLFPHSSVLHLGGDEVPEGAWTQSPRAAAYGRENDVELGPDVAGALVAEAAAAIEAAGRGWAGWQEVGHFEHPIQPAYVVAWTSSSAIGEMLDRGHSVVASPADAYYLDMAIDNAWSTPGASWAGSTSLAATCDFDMADPHYGSGHLLGGQAAIWGEHVSSLEILDELLFPRLDAVAEATWTDGTVGRADDIAARSLSHPTLLRSASSTTNRNGER